MIDLARRTIIHRVFVGAGAHHLGISPEGKRIWVALGETAKTIVRLDSSNPRRPRVVGRFRPRFGAHDIAFAPGGGTVLVTSPSGSDVSAYSPGGRRPRLLWYAGAGRAPEHVVFSGSTALISSGYGSSLEALSVRSPSRAPIAMLSASTSKWRRRASRVSLMPKPSVPSGTKRPGTKRATTSAVALM